MRRRLEGRVAIVTGGVRRLGKGMALAFARDGASVVIDARARRGGRKGRCRGGSGRRQGDGAHRRRYGRGRGQQNGRRHGGRVRPRRHPGEQCRQPCRGAVLQMTYKQWRDILGVILDGAFLCSRAALPHMVKNKSGRSSTWAACRATSAPRAVPMSARQGRHCRLHPGAGVGIRTARRHRELHRARPHWWAASATSGRASDTIRRSAAKAPLKRCRRWCGSCASRTTATSQASPTSAAVFIP